MNQRDRDPALVNRFLQEEVDPDQAIRYLFQAHEDDLREIRDNPNPLFDEIPIIAGDVLERRREKEEAVLYDGSLTLEMLLRQEDVNAGVLDTFLHAATNKDLWDITNTSIGYDADQATEILVNRFKLQKKVWVPGTPLPKDRKGSKKDAEDDTPEDKMTEVED